MFFQERLLELMEANGTSKRELSEALGVSISCIYKWFTIEKDNVNVKKFSAILNDLLKRAEISPAQLCKRLDLPLFRMQKWLRSESVPNFEQLRKLCKYFSIPYDVLLEPKTE